VSLVGTTPSWNRPIGITSPLGDSSHLGWAIDFGSDADAVSGPGSRYIRFRIPVTRSGIGIGLDS
jgi:hypothetical protein